MIAVLHATLAFIWAMRGWVVIGTMFLCWAYWYEELDDMRHRLAARVEARVNRRFDD